MLHLCYKTQKILKPSPIGDIIKTVKEQEDLIMNTKHFSLDRNDRNDFIKKYIGYGNVVKTFTVDRGHKNGAEWHTVTSTGLIIVQNAHTHRLVTILIARPNQIKRLYENKGLTAPGYLIDLARKHQEYGYNNL